MEVDEKPLNGTKAKDNLPWLEKYRPRVLDDVVGNSEIISRFKFFAKVGNVPHLILVVSFADFKLILIFRVLLAVEKQRLFTPWLMKCWETPLTKL